MLASPSRTFGSFVFLCSIPRKLFDPRILRRFDRIHWDRCRSSAIWYLIHFPSDHALESSTRMACRNIYWWLKKAGVQLDVQKFIFPIRCTTNGDSFTGNTLKSLGDKVFLECRELHAKQRLIQIGNSSIHGSRATMCCMEGQDIRRVVQPRYCPALLLVIFIDLWEEKKFKYVQIMDTADLFFRLRELSGDIFVEKLMTVFQTWMKSLRDLNKGDRDETSWHTKLLLGSPFLRKSAELGLKTYRPDVIIPPFFFRRSISFSFRQREIGMENGLWCIRTTARFTEVICQNSNMLG
jgi:hypothetical protein